MAERTDCRANSRSGGLSPPRAGSGCSISSSASDQFQNRFGRLFREYGLTSSQYNILRIPPRRRETDASLKIADRDDPGRPGDRGPYRPPAGGRMSHPPPVRNRPASGVHRADRQAPASPSPSWTQPVIELHRDLLRGHLSRTELQGAGPAAGEGPGLRSTDGCASGA